MNISKTHFLLSLALLVAGPVVALRAAAPVAQSLTGDSCVLGEATALHAQLTDADGDLDHADFYVTGPGVLTWSKIGTATASGATFRADVGWLPPSIGIYTVRVEVYDKAGNGASNSAAARLDNTLEIFAQRITVQNLTVANGAMRVFNADGEIRTKENTAAAEVVIQSGGTAVFWAKNRINLKPGFRAQAGSTFWAGIDHNLNGYTDVEEVTDYDRDGIPDAWEFDHGLDLFNAADAAADRDQDGLTNLQEYKGGTNIDVKDNPAFRFVIYSPVI
jgi:hypothetical protein